LTKYGDRATATINGKEHVISSLDYNFMKMMKEKIVSLKPQDEKIVIAYEDARGKIQQKEIILQ